MPTLRGILYLITPTYLDFMDGQVFPAQNRIAIHYSLSTIHYPLDTECQSLRVVLTGFLHFVTELPVLPKVIANCVQVKSLCLEETFMSDTQVFVALAVALIPGLLALRLSTALYK